MPNDNHHDTQARDFRDALLAVESRHITPSLRQQHEQEVQAMLDQELEGNPPTADPGASESSSASPSTGSRGYWRIGFIGWGLGSLAAAMVVASGVALWFNQSGSAPTGMVLHEQQDSLAMSDQAPAETESSPIRPQEFSAEANRSKPAASDIRRLRPESQRNPAATPQAKPVPSPPAVGQDRHSGHTAGALKSKQMTRPDTLADTEAQAPRAAGTAGVHPNLPMEPRQRREVQEPTFEPPPTHPGPRPHGGDAYATTKDNPFRAVRQNPLSTFSIDVDTASYANVRRFINAGRLPPRDAIRIEEMINYFGYRYPEPDGEHPLAIATELADCPWQPGHKLLRVALKAEEVAAEQRPQANLVFLVDVSGSMNQPDKLPLLQYGMQALTWQLNDRDRVAIVAYAGRSGLVLPSTAAHDRHRVLDAISRLRAGGSTAGASGIELAYRVAREQFIPGGNNRVVLATDGDFNVGISDTASLVSLIEQKRQQGVFLSVLGFGRGNLNDAMMEKLTNAGNGNYSYIDSQREAEKVLVHEVGGTMLTVAKDVKLQLEFNPARVSHYRLIGYANRLLADEDFNDDTKDAGEIGAGHTVTALYQIVPVGAQAEMPRPQPTVDPLKYQQPPAEARSQPEPRELTDAAASGEWLTVKLRYKQPDGHRSRLLTHPVAGEANRFDTASSDLRFAAAVAGLGMKLRRSPYAGDVSYHTLQSLAAPAVDAAPNERQRGYRQEFVELIRRAAMLDRSE